MKRYILLLTLICFSLPSVAQKKTNYLLLDSIFNYMCQKGIKHGDIVIRQVIVETGWLKSPFLMSRNNLFGFRSKKYIRFKSWKSSVDYYKKWQDKNYTNSKEDYYQFLIRIKYASAKNYTQYLKRINYTKTCK
jgi:hypothetical protein